MTALKRVLVVEDDPSLQRLVAAVLRRSGLAADCAADGQEALEKIEQSEYNLVLLDMMMPRMDGFAFLAELDERGENAPFRGPIIAMTAAADALVGRIDGIRVQAVVRKPFDIDQLVSFVSRALENGD